MKHRRGSGHGDDASRRDSQDTRTEQTGRFARGTLTTSQPLSADAGLDEALVIAKGVQDTIAQVINELHLMSERAGTAGPGITHGIDRSLHALMPAQRMAAEIADLAYIDARRLVLRREPTELGELLTETVDHYVLPVQRRAVHLDLRHTSKSRIDRERMQRVIASFLHSAVTYGFPGSPVVIRLEEDDRRACVSMSDVGPGLTSTQAHAIFERRHPAGGRTQPIGLYVSRKIVEAHGGEVGVDSTPSVGTTFWFALPVTG